MESRSRPDFPHKHMRLNTHGKKHQEGQESQVQFRVRRVNIHVIPSMLE
jgi:hypothetical protein